MKNIYQLLFVTMLLVPFSANALVEGRITYGSLASSQNLTDICNGSCTAPANAPAIVPTFGAGLDVIVTLPMIPFGFGVRTESMKLSTSNSGIDAEIKYNRTAVILNYRLIDTIVHFGPIATVGVAHSGSASIVENGTTKVDLSPGSISSYSLGLELEVKPLIVLPLIVGAEAGYESFKWGQVTNNVDGTQKDIDLSGTYLKAFIGLDF
jgi:hypothetical protein